MILGMGIVFIFLTLLYGAIVGLASLLEPYTVKELRELQTHRDHSRKSRLPESAALESIDRRRLVAAITAAIAMHRSRHR